MSIFDSLLNFIASGLDFSNFNPLVLLPLLGMYGGGGGGDAKEPKLDVGKSLKLSEGQIEQLIKYAPEVASTLGAVSRDQSALNTIYGVDLLADPKGTLREAARDDIRIKKQDELQKINKWKTNQEKKKEYKKNPELLQKEYDKKRANIVKKYDKQLAGVKDIDPIADLKSTFKTEFKQRDDLLKSSKDSIKSTSEYNRLQKALGEGLTAETIGARTATAAQVANATPVTAAQINPLTNIASRDIAAAQLGAIADIRAQQVDAARMGDFGSAVATNISAGQAEAGALGDSLMARAQRGIALGGRLSAEAERDAINSARSGMAARGMATGKSALAAELLNRDRYARQRELEDLQFAGGVQAADQTRQFQNISSRLTADQANQQAALTAETANLQARYNAAAQQGNWQQAAALANQTANLTADQANQNTAFNVQSTQARLNQEADAANRDAALRADTQNQLTELNRQTSNTSEANRIALANQADQTNRDIYNIGQQNETSRFNATQQSAADVFNANALYGNQLNNIGLLGQSSSLADAERARQLGTQQDIYNFSMSTNPRMMLAGVGSPYANMTQPTIGQLGAITSGVEPVYTGGQFSSGGGQSIHSTISGLVGAGMSAYWSGGNPAATAAGYQAGTSLGNATTNTWMNPIKTMSGGKYS